MNTTNANGQSIDQFVSTLASLLEYAIPANGVEKYEQALYSIYYGTTGDDDILDLVALLRGTALQDQGCEYRSTVMNGEETGPY